MRLSKVTAGVMALSFMSCGQPEPEQAPLDAEAIVVGAGIAGLSAAVEMGRSGVNVLLLDMNSVMGGHAVMAGGFAIVDTPIQKREGFQDSPELAYADWMEWTEDGNPEWSRYYAENSREMIYDWSAEMGVEFVRVQVGYENSVPRFHFTPRGAFDVVLAPRRRDPQPRRARLRARPDASLPERGRSQVQARRRPSRFHFGRRTAKRPLLS